MNKYAFMCGLNIFESDVMYALINKKRNRITKVNSSKIVHNSQIQLFQEFVLQSEQNFDQNSTQKIQGHLLFLAWKIETGHNEQNSAHILKNRSS